MPNRQASVSWHGDPDDGGGRTSLDSSGAATFEVSLPARLAEEAKNQTDPEELIGAALATCFTMNLSLVLDKADYRPESLETKAVVTLVKNDTGLAITEIALSVVGRVHDVDQDTFAALAVEAEQTCPVSKALAGTSITLDAQLGS